MNESIFNAINQLKKDKNAVIMAHYYTTDEVQALADYVGDSFYLAKLATKTDASTVVLCGVSFMSESVKILNPNKTVLIPDARADCPMAHMVDVKKIKDLRQRYDDLAVVCYINSTAEIKCLSDVCVTSSNAIKIVRKLPNQNIFFIPDQNLGRYVAEQVPEKNIILNDGFCPIHASVTASQLQAMKKIYPNAKVLTHPECSEELLALSDYIGSTAEIIDFAQSCDSKEFIVCTENGVGYPLKRLNPDKSFYFLGEGFCCADMKLNTPEKILHVLQTGENEIKIDEKIRLRALAPLNKMLELAK